MNDPKPRKQAPKVTEEIDRDLANLNGQVQPNRAPAASNKAAAVEPSQPEPRPFHELVDYSKLQFGQKLIGWCIFLIVAFSLIGYFSNGADPNGNELGTAIELLKLVTTTALGFVFAKTQIAAQQSKKDDDDK
ncbi:hypothetical protein FRC0028_00055 [Corynebacterium diphtheriae]|nr:hypothetical protein FRC0081_00054 [Corynebacterium diphtheriae]CAB0673033.1 hypothetical protein FRC0028_00055 [Corynebacterium diphtheriae]CAB0729210.1 hypothetical protein FRC0134_00054 [Corynebacterium diphtheriae]CAB0764119.1 hypothetical protein FRC0174_00054 [Corynebacterium diphtheriae]CAB0885517.1 hypothetical protein FRC0423_00054 [Corynebacterium diphtheriae]